MDQITLRVPVAVKAKVTQALKDRILKGADQALSDIDREMQNLDFTGTPTAPKETGIVSQGLISLRAKVEEQKQRLAAAKAKAQHDREEAEQLTIGSEIRQGTLEQTVVVNVGDDLEKLMGTEILLEDGKIVSIRQ